MRIKPILFKTEMVQAIFEGRKTQTRRAVKPQPIGCTICIGRNGDRAAFGASNECVVSDAKIPYDVGDILWVREKFCVGRIDVEDTPYPGAAEYIAQCLGDNDVLYYEKCVRENIDLTDVVWKPSIHMPKAAARIFLRVTGVQVGRIQETSEKDAKAEGVLPCGEEWEYGCYCDGFRALWDSINKKGGYGWDANPWVWVITFERCEKPKELISK